MTITIEETTIARLQTAMSSGEITSKELVIGYLERIARFDQAGVQINSVLEINPDAIYLAEALDMERGAGRVRGPMHGIPVMLKDNINTGDKMHTSAGSLALTNSYAPKDAFLAARLREAGAVILGKTNMTEFANFMTKGMPSGYSSRGGQTRNPYGPGQFDVGGSSSGSAAAVAANFCMVSVGTETSGSILDPSYYNGIVGIKPTLGLISRTGIVPITFTQDTAGPMARTVADAAILLGAMAGEDADDPATWTSRGRSSTDYTAYLDDQGLKGARIGINRGYEKEFTEEEKRLIEASIETMRRAGAEIIEGTDLPHIADHSRVLLYEFKAAMNSYLASLGPSAPMSNLGEIVDFNHRHPKETLKYGQKLLLAAELETSGRMTEPRYLQDRLRDWRASREEGIDRVMDEHRLDALFCPGVTDSPAVSGYPAVIVPAGYREDGQPFGVSFAGKAYSEPTLLRIAYAFEQEAPVRKAPPLS